MSVINKKPFIIQVLETLSVQQVETLAQAIDGQGSEPIFRSLLAGSPNILKIQDAGIKPAEIEVARPGTAQRVYQGYLIYTGNEANQYCVLIHYSDDMNQDLSIVNMKFVNGNWSHQVLPCELSITELRSELNDLAKAEEKQAVDAVYDALEDGSLPIKPKYISDKDELITGEDLASGAIVSVAGFNADGEMVKGPMPTGSPKGVYATLEALQTAYPTGAEGIYVVQADGHWYYWNGSAWTDGGTYLSTINAVPETRTIAGIDLEDDITKSDLQSALDIDKIYEEPTNYGSDAINQNLILSSNDNGTFQKNDNVLEYSSTASFQKYIGIPLTFLGSGVFSFEIEEISGTGIDSITIARFTSSSTPGYVLNTLTKTGNKYTIERTLSDAYNDFNLVINPDVSQTTDNNIVVKINIKYSNSNGKIKGGLVEKSSLSDALQQQIDFIVPSKQSNTNVFVGVDAGKNTTEASSGDNGKYNAGFGVNAMKENTTGDHCSAFGFQALQKNTSGDGNTALGEDTLYENTTGGNNVAVGSHAAQNNNGDNNVAVGAGAMIDCTTGFFNTCVGGYENGSNITTGARNTLVGAGANINNGALNDCIVLGMATATEEGQIKIGSSRSTKITIKLSSGEKTLIFNSDGTVSWE